MASAGTSSIPSGLAWEEASLATNLVAATPTEAGTPMRSRTSARIHLAMATGGPMRRRAPETSRKASSTLTFSVSGVTCSRMSITRRETREYRPWRTGRTTAWGQRRCASVIDMAEATP